MKSNEFRIRSIVTINNPESWKDLKDIPMRVIGINQCLGINDMPTYCVSMMVLDNSKINKYTFQIFSQYIEFIEPIQITEEILFKCGFDKMENNWKYIDLVFATISWERLSGLSLTFKNESIYLPHIKYLHQLQNLYYALTNEELEINL